MIERTVEDFKSYADFFYKQDSTGRTAYSHHMDLYEETGVVSDELKEPPIISGAFSHVKEWFEELSLSRMNYIGMGIAYAPLQMNQIESYFRLKRISHHIVEFDVLLMFDRIFLSVMNESKKDE